MEILLVRHGEASSFHHDAKEGLSLLGREQIGRAARFCRRMGLHFDLVLSSTKKRAYESGAIFADTLGYKMAPLQSEKLLPNCSFAESISLISSFKDRSSILIAGHLPSLSLLLSGIISDGAISSLLLDNASCSLVRIKEMEAMRGELLWHIPGFLLQQMQEKNG